MKEIKIRKKHYVGGFLCFTGIVEQVSKPEYIFVGHYQVGSFVVVQNSFMKATPQLSGKYFNVSITYEQRRTLVLTEISCLLLKRLRLASELCVEKKKKREVWGFFKFRHSVTSSTALKRKTPKKKQPCVGISYRTFTKIMF